MKDGEFRLLLCGSRRHPWPHVIRQAVEHFHHTHGNRLTLIEGAARGADRTVHNWWDVRGRHLGVGHHCHPVDWEAARATRPDWRAAGNERNTDMLARRPHQIIGFHEAFTYARGGTSDMLLKGLLSRTPTWLIPGDDLRAGVALNLNLYPQRRRDRAMRELRNAAILP